MLSEILPHMSSEARLMTREQVRAFFVAEAKQLLGHVSMVGQFGCGKKY